MFNIRINNAASLHQTVEKMWLHQHLHYQNGVVLCSKEKQQDKPVQVLLSKPFDVAWNQPLYLAASIFHSMFGKT